MDPLLVVLVAVVAAALILGFLDWRRGREPDPGAHENPYRWMPPPMH